MSTSTEATRVLPEITVNKEIADAIQNATTTDGIKSLLASEAEKQGAAAAQLAVDQAAAEQARLDQVAADAVAAQAAAAAEAARSFKRTENIGGKNFEFDGASEAEVDRLVLNAYKMAYTLREERPAVAEVVPDAAAVAAAAEAEAAAKADLEKKFRLGEVSAKDYIEQSGAINQYLESQGLSVAALRDAVNANIGAQTAQSWSQAGETFRNSSAGADWPGGQRNQEVIAMKLSELGLLDAKDKVAALAEAYNALKQKNTFFPYGDFNTEAEWRAANGRPAVATAAVAQTSDAAQVAATAAAAAAAADAARVQAALKTRSASAASSMWGQSSGTSGASTADPAVAAAKTIVPPDATPQEIMQAWKDAQVAGGINPDVAFRATHQGRN
jgi:hypothetical protein